MDVPLLFCEGLTKSYGSLSVIKDLDLTLPMGKTVGLFGCGKTTLIKLITGLSVSSAGKLEICGLPPSAATSKLISYLPERCALPRDISAEEFVSFYEKMFDDFDAGTAKSLLKELRVNTKKPMGALSMGTRDKLALIFAMSRRARLYLLDEPIRENDAPSNEFLFKTLFKVRAEGSTVLIATHLPREASAHLDTFLFLSEGRITQSAALADLGKESFEEAIRRTVEC